jgi:IS1 family transposase
MKAGKRRRYSCLACGKTFGSTKTTPYYRLHHRRTVFDEVVSLSVEGVNKSAISRVKRISWNTVHRWLKKAATCCRRFNDRKTSGLEIPELQADELRTFIGGKERLAWIFTAIDVWSRFWPSTIIGRRSYRNTLVLFRDISPRMKSNCMPLVVTDGFELYEKVTRQVFGPTCLYGQVLKTRRNDRIIKVERRAVTGAAWRFEEALLESEDSSTLNTSFVERLNLTIRQASAYLTRRTTCHARCMEQLRNQLEIVRYHYNFMRPHRALKFGSETRTPAMQAGLTVEGSRSATSSLRRSFLYHPRESCTCSLVEKTLPLKRRSFQHLMAEAPERLRAVSP